MRVHAVFVCVCVYSMVCLAAASPSGWVTKETAPWTEFPAPLGWRRTARADAAKPLQLIIAVKQRNTNALKNILWDVSDPDSKNYGKHLTFQEVNDLVRPDDISVAQVLVWLSAGGVSVHDKSVVTRSSNSDFITVLTTVAVAEQLLSTQYYTFIHDASGEVVTRCDAQYSLPEHVAEHVDFVGPTVRFPAVQSVRVKVPSRVAKNLRKKGLAASNGVTPDFLRQLYGVGSYSAKSTSNIQAVASFLNQFYSPTDLQTFFQQYDKEAVGRTAKLFGPNEPGSPGTEASLDIQYIMAMGNNVNTQFWSTLGQQPHNPGNEPFLTWLTNVTNLPDNEMPATFSVSYGDNEKSVNFAYAVRCDTEFMKLGARGVSILFASGDGGVAGGQSSFCTKFIPTWPAGSVYVTAVGGTTSSSPEVAASFSSGGFSNYWGRPSYQDSYVTEYFKVAKNLPPSLDYNGTGAGIPDVSAQSEGFAVVQGGFSEPVDGTSCAAPTFSGIVGLLNDQRAAAGKSKLGWLNPLFYKNPSAFNDVTEGNNPGCSTNGFYAAKGWDPVTGLGTPNFPALTKIVAELQ